MSVTWTDLLTVYRAALAAEDAYDAAHIAIPDHLPGNSVERSAAIAAVSREHWDEIARLQAIRHDAEDPLMAYPSPDLTAFAVKFLVAHGDDRGGGGWDEMLQAEATRLIGESRHD